MNQQEQAPILTTREAVEAALYSLAGSAQIERALGNSNEWMRDRVACALLCDLYGFKLEQFFGEDGAKEIQ